MLVNKSLNVIILDKMDLILKDRFHLGYIVWRQGWQKRLIGVNDKP